MLRFAAWLVLLLLAAPAAAQTKDRPTKGGAQSRDRTLAVAPAIKSAELRHALVIGNSAYLDSPLKNPVNDARAMAKALGAAGFNVQLLEDATHAGMQRAVRLWGNNIAKGGIGLFYYAGHGMQVKGRNYLVPVNAEIDQEDEIEFNTLDVNLVLAKMDSAKNALNIVILDACRNNPFARSFRSMSRGLAQMDAPTGTFIAFATAPGSTASDGSGQNGLYTEYLLKEMQKPGVPIEQMFKQIRISVMKDTKDQQIPWESSSMRGDFSFRPGAPVTVAVVAPAAAAASEAMVATAVSQALKRERELQQQTMEKMITAALERQRAMLEEQGLKVQQAAPPPKPAGPDPREKELKAAAERAAAERAAAEKMLAEARAASEKAAAEKLAAQKAVAELAAAEKAAADRTAAAKLAAEQKAAERLAAEKAAVDRAAAAKLAAERAAAERLAAEKAAAELRAATQRAAAEKAAAEKEKAEKIQLAAAAPVSIAASSSSGRLPQQGDTWTYRLNEPNRNQGPKQRTYAVRVTAATDAAILEQYGIQGEPTREWAHAPGAYIVGLDAALFSPYLAVFQDLAPGQSMRGIQINDPACSGRFACEADAKVVGTETVTVPAGTFAAIKVVVEQSWRPVGNSFQQATARAMGSRDLIVWYSPQLKRAVKFRSRLNVGDLTPIETDFDLELVSYQLK